MNNMCIPVGPQHPAWVEPLHLKLVVDGEEVTDADIQLGYVHRGVEKALETRTWVKSVYLAGRTCGICSQSHTSCFSLGVEQLLGIQVPDRGSYVRTIFNELERIHSHLLLVAHVGHVIGFETAFHYIWRDRELSLELFEMLSGKRVQQDINTAGGPRWEINTEHIKKMEENLDRIKERASHYLKLFRKDVSIRKRLRGRGVLTSRQVKESSLVGPVARASGVNIDVRNLGYMAYPDVRFRPVLGEEGDDLERMLVRLKEVVRSAEMIEDALVTLPRGEIRTRVPLNVMIPPGKESVSMVEAPRGELLYYMRSAGLKPDRVRIRTPTYANFAGARHLIVGQQVADIPVNIVSIDPCMACCDRMTLTNAGTGRSKVFSDHDLVDWGDGRGKWE
jgi:Ni,Fe-hydrogenase III large subunit